MKNLLLILVTAIVCSVGTVHASDIVHSERDCAEILEQWANDPDSVPQHLVDECKEMMAGVTSVPDIAPSAGGQQAADPCVGSGSASSVHCWGPWIALATAASGVTPPDNLLPIDDFEVRPELAALYDPDPLEGPDPVNPIDPPVDPPIDPPIDPPAPPDLELSSCVAGTSCGFATIVDGVTGQGAGQDTTIAIFDLASDGSQFSVAPGETGEIASVGNMLPTFTNRPDGFENMNSSGTDGDERSRLIARIIRDTGGSVVTAADAWAHGNTATSVINSGFFAWGNSISQADVNALNNSAVSTVFSGPMSVDNATTVSVTLNFGSTPTWTGDWTNPGYTFAAGGVLTGVDLISDPVQFSSNVGANSFVQGALLGDIANKSIAHFIDVDITGVGRIRDVGLLLE
ncbi:MAG: hypothetical protein QGH93_06660 [Gammaproteobacteria bacterium]|nr:hypothetical protein [Gammaproteobacteria bacterium]